MTKPVLVSTGAAAIAMPWLESLERATSTSDLRATLAARHPAFAPAALRELAILGAAEEGRRLAALCADRGIALRAIADDDPKRRGRRVGPCTVASLESLAALDRTVPVVIASHRILKASERLRAMRFRNTAPFALLQTLQPAAFPPHMFYAGLLEDLYENRARYRALTDRLADDASRQALDAAIGFRLTLDASLLAPVIDRDLYAPAGLITYHDEVYVDGGAYDGDSVRLFLARAGDRVARVLAFEPDAATFRRLAQGFAHEPRVETINAGLHRKKATLRFTADGTRGAAISAQGGIDIPVVGLDEVLGGARVTFIKMNIEGAELEALRGAAQSIRRCRPKLAISAYHRPSDLWAVPELVGKLCPDYRLYLRQHDGGIIETVLYATR